MGYEIKSPGKFGLGGVAQFVGGVSALIAYLNNGDAVLPDFNTEEIISMDNILPAVAHAGAIGTAGGVIYHSVASFSKHENYASEFKKASITFGASMLAMGIASGVDDLFLQDSPATIDESVFDASTIVGGLGGLLAASSIKRKD